MRNDLQALVRLWEKEKKIKGYKAEFLERKSVVTKRSESIRKCELELKEIASNEILLEKRLEDLDAQIATLSERIQTLRNALSQGIVQDFHTAEVQINNGLTSIDDKEDEYLQILQDQEEAT